MPPNDIINYSGVFYSVELERDPEHLKEDESEFETAINSAGFGKFQKILLSVSGIIYATCAISSTTLSFVLPSAECDFHLTSVDKGKLSAMPLIGMVFGCCLWGSVANSHGRKTAILISLLVDFLAATTSSFAHSFSLFLICRFFNGFGIIGATSIIFSYLGEFLSVSHRDKVLGKLEIFWNIGVILLPGMAWFLLSRKMIDLFQYGGSFSPWRIFVLVCGLPSLISVVLLYFLPETPRFLISKGKYSKAKLVLQKMYAYNAGECMENFPIYNLKDEDNNIEKVNFQNCRKTGFISKLNDVFYLLKSLVSHQYLRFLAITCFADFGLMASYYTLVMWFPEIFDRFDEYASCATNITSGICMVSQFHPSIRSNKDIEDLLCVPTIENKVFLETLIIGVSCIPTSCSLGYFMHRFGKKFVLVFGLILSGIITLGLNFVSSATETLVLSCLFESFTSILEAVLFCVIIDLFPTNLRALALTITATTGRLGAIFGNIIFGILLDLNYCIIPIYLFGFLLIASGFLCLLVPRNENYIAIN